MSLEATSVNPGQTGDIDRAAIEEQLERLLSNRHFSHSRRFPAFLRFVVEKTLSGSTDAVKERALGIEIFGRCADYDTSSDPIVRVTAAEIRKRIAQYYQEPGHDLEIRVMLPAGSYVPQFHWPHALKAGPPLVGSELDPRPAPPVPVEAVALIPPARYRRKRRWLVLAAALLVIVAGAGGSVLLRSLLRS